MAISLGVLALFLVSRSDAQSTPRLVRVAMLRGTDDPSPGGPLSQNVAALKEGLAGHGDVEGRNLVMEYADRVIQ